MLEINDEIGIPERELQLDFTRAGGPGGQKVDRTASAVQLRFNIAKNETLPAEVKRRLRRLAANRINQQDELIIEAGSHRSQVRNRQDARERLASLLRRAARRPTRRKPTRRPKGATERRLRNKKHRSRKKRQRKYDPRRDR